MGQVSADLAEEFKKYFSVDLATTPEQKLETYRVRYRVYCDEFGFEDGDNYPDKAERDEFDDYAIQCLVSHRASGIPAGCVRLVPATVNANYHILPFEKYCAAGLDNDYLHGLDMDRGSICEISRLMVDSAFRQRSGETLTHLGRLNAMDFSRHEERAFSLVAVAGYLATTALTGITGRTNVFAMMEPFLPGVLSGAGINFRRVGSDVDYHGVRAPYFIRTESVVENMQPQIRELYDAIYEQVAHGFQAANGEYAIVN
jgi:N-acyl amino acid synthase of PEP-CTERM/exosortase system